MSQPTDGPRDELRDENRRLRALLGLVGEGPLSEADFAAAADREGVFLLAVDAARVGTWTWDIASDRMAASSRSAEIVGLPGAAAAGDVLHVGYRDFMSVVHPDDRDRVQQTVDAAMTSESGTFAVEYRVVRPDGTVRWVEGRGGLRRDAAGRPVRMIGTSIDVTSRRQIEEHLFRAQRDESIGRLAGGVAHDFNNLLTTILGIVETVRATRPAGDPVRDELAPVVEAAKHGASLTRQLLAYARKQVVQPVVADMNELVAETEDMLRRLVGEHIELVVRRSSEPAPVRVDPSQFQQVLLNLGVNARDAMPGGGRLTFETSLADVVPSEAAFDSGATSGVALVVTDTGSGMDPDVLDRLFEPFFTTKPVGQGTGLGLATCYGIVTQCGGTIGAESAPGRGTTFRILLPRAQPAEPAATSASPAPAPATAPSADPGGTVLFVEDAHVIREMASIALRNAGFRVIAAEDGEAALVAARAHEGPIDLVVTDMVMPRMGGPELARHIRVERPSARILLASGYPGDDVTPEENVEFLPKPYTPSVLIRRVREILARR